MLSDFTAGCRLACAGFQLARHDGFIPTEQLDEMPWPARAAVKLARIGRRHDDEELSTTLARIGPSYIKLGQFLATRPDIVGAARASELRVLQDRLPPFSMEEARSAILANFGVPVEVLFTEFSPPVAAASIAQVHRAKTTEGRDVAVKILRPGIENQFARDLESFRLAARLAERASAEGRRLQTARGGRDARTIGQARNGSAHGSRRHGRDA